MLILIYKRNMNLGLLLSADWCGHCQRFYPIWKELNKNMETVDNLLLTNIDNNKIDSIQKGGSDNRKAQIEAYIVSEIFDGDEVHGKSIVIPPQILDVVDKKIKDVKGFPSIYFINYKNDETTDSEGELKLEEYEGERSLQALMEHIATFMEPIHSKNAKESKIQKINLLERFKNIFKPKEKVETEEDETEEEVDEDEDEDDSKSVNQTGSSPFNNIYDPITGQEYSIYSKKGVKILNKLIRTYRENKKQNNQKGG